ncbi:unnamed protein product (macronuclear) [Paramecium tetraurelia]|uniref:Protein ARV n=1 Tax=Paramecium tetraurelia TaxID=5888 RepID=A0BAQ2_PARTE|nr:uncharacterized protein GSPATT00000054001 [Paramecium tetraurelia]CAK55619.1 unnamed protein product [Paramecium tetraurelia]|eukprot:XP_001423017.1 hypothetical protein (macronuclear) [Paramecium tetraurelia strain d4-2]
MNCVNCNTKVENPDPMTQCPHCNHENQDWYFGCENNILLVDMILCKVSAYRHLLINSQYTLIPASFILFITYILLELFYKYQSNILHKQEQELNFEDVQKQTIDITLTLLSQIVTIYIISLIIFRKLQHQQMIIGLILSQFGRLAIIMFVIWGHQPFYKQMASLSIIMSEWTTIRSLCEYKNEWLKSGIVIILTVLLRYFVNNSITIL